MIPAELIKERVTIPMLLEQYGIRLNRNNRCACPIHNGKDENFSVKGDRFKCFVCGAAGSVIDLQMALSNHPLNVAINDLDAMFGLGLASHKPSDRIRAEYLKFERKQRQAMAEKVSKWNNRQYDLISRARRLRWERGGDCDEIDAALDELDHSKPIPSAATLAASHGLIPELLEVEQSGTIRPGDEGNPPQS